MGAMTRWWLSLFYICRANPRRWTGHADQFRDCHGMVWFAANGRGERPCA